MRGGGPTEILTDPLKCGGGHALALRGVLNQGDNGVGKGLGLIGKQGVLAVDDGQPLGADGGGDEGKAGGHAFEDFDPGAAADTEGEDHDGGAGEVGADVIDGACDFDAGVLGGESADGGGGIAADEDDFHFGAACFNAGVAVADEVLDGIDIGVPVHAAEEGERGSGGGAGAEEVAIDAGGHPAEDVFHTPLVAEGALFVLRDGDLTCGMTGGVVLKGAGELPFAAADPAAEGIGGGLDMALPDEGLDIVLEDDGGHLRGGL